MRELYLECYSGISGDMTVAALLDLGVPGEHLMKELEKLHLDGYEIKISRTKKNQITATDFDVILKDEHKEEHGHEHAHTHVNDEDVKECHEQEHSHTHCHEEQEIEKKKTAVNETKEEMKNKDEQKGFHDVQTETVCVMETNVDDCSGEQLGYAREVLLKAGALDVCCMPLYMKKGRPSYLFQIICKPADEEALKTILFRETTSIGFRRYEEERQKLDREMISVTLLDGNTIRIKKCMHHDVIYYYPEYEDVRKTCEMRGEAFRMVYEEARSLAEKSEE